MQTSRPIVKATAAGLGLWLSHSVLVGCEPPKDDVGRRDYGRRASKEVTSGDAQDAQSPGEIKGQPTTVLSLLKAQPFTKLLKGFPKILSRGAKYDPNRDETVEVVSEMLPQRITGSVQHDGINPWTDPFGYERFLLFRPIEVTEVAVRELHYLNKMFQLLAGERGWLALGDVLPVPGVKGQKTLSLPKVDAGFPAPEYAVLSHDPAATPPWSIDFYQRYFDFDVRRFERTLRLEITPLAGDPSQASFKALHTVVSAEYPDFRDYFTVSWETGAEKATILRGVKRIGNGAAPGRFEDLFVTTVEGVGDGYNITGGLRWYSHYTEADTEQANDLVYHSVNDEVGVFALTAQRGSDALALRFGMLLPSAAQAADYQLSPPAFQAHDMGNVLRRNLVFQLRNADLNSDCGTLGASIKRWFVAEGRPVPPAAAAAPVDLCSTNAAFTDEQFVTMLESTCGAGPTPEIYFGALGQRADDAAFGLCERVAHYQAVQGPVQVDLRTGLPSVVLWQNSVSEIGKLAPISPVHAANIARLGALTLDFKVLKETEGAYPLEEMAEATLVDTAEAAPGPGL